MRTSGLLGGVVIMALGLGVSTARAEPNPSIVAQQPMVQGAQGEWLTADPSPSFLVQSPTVGALTCTLDDGSDQPCGPAPASCPQATCAVYSPGTLKDGEHSLEADDSSGLGTDFDFDVDTTPPRIGARFLVSQEELTDPQPFHPRFAFNVTDDDSYARDVSQCSLVRAPSSPRWSHCDGPLRFAPALPRHGAQYTIGIRARDLFGRLSAPVFVSYDPMPCRLGSVTRPSGLSLERHGMNVQASCRGVPRLRIDVYAIAYGRRRIARRQVGSPIGWGVVHATGHRQRVHVRLHTGYTEDNYLKGYRTVRLQAVLTPGRTRVTTSANSLGAAVTKTFTIVNPGSTFDADPGAPEGATR